MTGPGTSGCAGLCQQGRKPCATPDACAAIGRHWASGSTPAEREADERPGAPRGVYVVAALLAVPCVAAAVAMALVWWGAR